MDKDLTITQGIFSSFIGSEMTILNREIAEDSEDRKDFHVYGISKQIIITLIRFGITTSEQLYGLLINLSKYYSMPDKKKLRLLLRTLHNSGYVEHIVIHGPNGQLDLYSPSMYALAVCSTSYPEYIAFAGRIIEQIQEPVFSENLCNILISNEFLKDTICTMESSHCKTCMHLEDSYLKDDNPFRDNIYGSISVRQPVKEISIIRKLKAAPRTQVFSYTALKNTSVFFNAEVFRNYMLAVEAYCRQKGLKKYLVIVIVPSVLQSFDFQANIDSNDKFQQKSLFYLEENSLFYGPMNNVFTLSGDSIRFIKF